MKKLPTQGGRPIRPREREAFLEHLAATGNVSRSAEIVSRSRGAFYALKKRDVEFSDAWEQAMEAAADELEAEARRRAVEGVDEPVIYQGKVARDPDGRPITVKKYSDLLLITLLNASRPEKFRRINEHRHAGPDGGAIQIDVRAVLFERLFPGKTIPSSGQ